MEMFKNANELCEMSIVQFGQTCSKFSVNELSTLKNMIALVQSEVMNKMQNVVQAKYTNINMTIEEYSTFCSVIMSMGGIVKDLTSKQEIVAYYFKELTPDCFKH